MTAVASSGALPHGWRGAAPFVSVVVPCRNERARIVPCLDSVLGGDYPADRLEVLVADGMSDDGTRERLAEVAARDPRVRVLDNPRRVTPAALNVGVRAARGDVIVRVDAHSEYPRDYVRALVGWLARSGADNVGGVCRTVPAGPGARARAIARALSHPLGVGTSHFRTGAVGAAAREVDTVPFGCWRRDVFARVGGFDEELVRNQDDEFNHRLRRAGGRVVLVPDVVTTYYARGTYAQLWRMMFQYGYYKPLAARKLGGVPTARQLVPPAFVAGLGGALVLAPVSAAAAVCAAVVGGAYTLAVLAAGVAEARRSGVPTGGLLAACFPVMHVAYGVGYLRGVWHFVVRRAPPVRDAAAVPVSH